MSLHTSPGDWTAWPMHTGHNDWTAWSVHTGPAGWTALYKLSAPLPSPTGIAERAVLIPTCQRYAALLARSSLARGVYADVA
jgi:hypothetical protein